MLAANGAPARSAPHPTGNPAAHAAAAGLRHAKFTLDNVTIAIASPFVPASKFTVAKPGAALQIATSISHKPFQELSVAAIPDGESGATQLAATGFPGEPETFAVALRDSQADRGPIASLFGKREMSRVWLTSLTVNGLRPIRALVVEWTAIAGHRTWIIRIVEEVSTNTQSLRVASPSLRSLTGLTVSAASVTRPSTVAMFYPRPGSGGRNGETGSANASTIRHLSAVIPSIAMGYLLPWAGGNSRYVTQGNNGSLPGGQCCGDHTGTEAYAWDFAVAGSSASWPIVAARGGTVSIIYESTVGSCYPDTSSSCLNSANRVVIDHGDGTQDLYLHVAYQSVTKYVSLGQVVSQGQVIADADTTGYSTGVHLHFMVEQECGIWWCQSVPSAFGDVSGGNPIAGSTYTSGNYGGGGNNCANAPNLSSPGNGATLTSRTVNFSWGPPGGCAPAGYTFRINTNPSGDNGPFIVDTGIGPGTPSYSYIFSGDGTYYWHVRACQPCTPYQPGAWANASFAINTTGGGGNLSPPTLQSPSNGATLNNRTVTFSWSPPNMANINGYTLHVSTTSTIDGGGSNLILDTGVGPTSYTYTFSQDYSTLWWGVATWNTSNQRSGFSGAWTFAINTTPADTTPPSESFTSPATDTLTAPCYTGGGYPGSVNLAVYASDNVAMGYVTFFRYDGASGSWVALNKLNGSGPTYQMTLDCGTLPLGWNEIDAMAVDTSNNFTNQWIGLDYETPPAPPSNLIGQAPSCGQVNLSWSDNSGNEDGFNVYRDGAYLNQVGANVASYQDFSVAPNTSYDYTVTAYSGSVESTPTSPATVNVPACPPDTTPPTEAFTSPTTNGQSASCYTGGSSTGYNLLQVNASDDVAVSYVTFFRWDNASANWVALSTLTSPPYQFTLDCATLQLGANDIDAMAVDTSNNFTNQSINLDYAVVPANDNLAGANVLRSPWYGVREDTSAASTSAIDPSSTCGAGVNSHSVWFAYTPRVVTPLYITTAGSAYDTVIAVWMVNSTALVQVTCDDDAYGALTSWVSFLPRPGYTYYIEVMSYSTSAGGDLHLTTSPTRMPSD